MNIETSDEADSLHPSRYGLPNDAALHKDGNGYQATDYRNVRHIIRILKPARDDVFYDLGCGKGRCVSLFGRLPIRRAVGIELNQELCRAARSNAACLRGRKAPIEIRCEDAAKADLSDGTIYFFFNPFGADTMRDVLAGIKQSLVSNPRRVTMVYFNPVLAETLRTSGWLHVVDEFKTFTGGRFTFWSND